MLEWGFGQVCREYPRGILGEGKRLRVGLVEWYLFLLFVLTQKVTKKSRLDLFAKKLKFLLRKFLNLRGYSSLASNLDCCRASDKRNFWVLLIDNLAVKKFQFASFFYIFLSESANLFKVFLHANSSEVGFSAGIVLHYIGANLWNLCEIISIFIDANSSEVDCSPGDWAEPKSHRCKNTLLSVVE